MRTLFLFLFLAAASSGASQNFKTNWEKTFPNAGKEAFHAILEATNGYLVAVGETSSKTRGGSDGLVVISDHSTGQTLAEVRLGGPKDDALYAVAQTFDGHFLLAGTTASAGAGNSDAWLVLVDERGQKIWETTFGSPGRDECRQMLLLPDGSLLLAGHRDGQKAGDIWLLKVQDKTVLWEKNIGTDQFKTLSGLAATTDGGVVFCGNTGKKAENGADNVFLAKVDAKGALVWEKFFGGKEWDEALSLLATRDGGFALAGLTKSKGAGDLDCWLIKTNRDGFQQWDQTYGGNDADIAHALVQTDEGGFLLAGATKSHRSGARSFAAFLVQTSPGGDLIWKQSFGKDKEDVFSAARILHDGSVVLAGTTNGDAGWLLQGADLYARSGLVSARDATAVQTSDAVVRTADGTLAAGEDSWVSFQISNNSDADLSDLRVLVDNRTGSPDLRFWNTNYCGKLRRGETTEARIPMRGDVHTAETSSQQLEFTVTAGGKTLKTLEKTILLRRPKPATLIIAGHTFTASGSSDQVTLSVIVENTGDSSSRAAEVNFLCPTGLSPAGSTVSPLGVVSAHSRREVKLVFVKTPAFPVGQPGRFTCLVKMGGREQVRKTLEWQPGGKASMVANGPIMIWQNPAPHETGSNRTTTSDDHINLKMTVVSPKAVHTKNIKIKVNGVEMDGSKFNEEELDQQSQEASKYIYSYKNVLPLVQGQNRVQVMVDGELSDEVVIEFVPERANLHILAIGPKHQDLQYTAKDAADFAAAFKNQGGADQLFNEVLIKTLVAENETDDKGIKEAMFDLAYQWKDGQIKPNDVLMVFISSHGKIVENRFKILQTGYNPKYDRLTIDFKTDILEILSPLNCKKLIFLDACHSGGAKEGFGGVSQAVVELAKAQPGVSTLTSCGPNEKSYEDKTWENGAFTEALMDAFHDHACTDAAGQFKADVDGDRILRLGELYDFLRRRVPTLVQGAVPNAPTSQTPLMPGSELDKRLPVYLLPEK